MSEKAKLSPKEKAEIVRRCLRNEISIGTASQEVCVNKTTILRWIAQYETEGAAVFLPHRGGRIYSEEVKRQAVQEYLSGMGSLRACLKSFDKNGGVGDNRKKQAGAGENASIPK